MKIDQDDEPDLEIGFLKCWIHARPYKLEENKYDRDWLTATIVYANEKLSFSDSGNFMLLSSFQSFSEKLKLMYENLKGKAALTSHEPNVQIYLECESLGHIKTNFEFNPNLNCKIELEEELDQSYLPKIASQVEKIIEKMESA